MSESTREELRQIQALEVSSAKLADTLKQMTDRYKEMHEGMRGKFTVPCFYVVIMTTE